MRLTTLPNQTAKLIELGFEKPNRTFTLKLIEHNDVKTDIDIPVSNYALGELLSFLPKEIDCNGFKDTLYIFVNQGAWVVEYSCFLGELYSTYRTELIDAVFDVCVKLKEEGVI